MGGMERESKSTGVGLCSRRHLEILIRNSPNNLYISNCASLGVMLPSVILLEAGKPLCPVYLYDVSYPPHGSERGKEIISIPLYESIVIIILSYY